MSSQRYSASKIPTKDGTGWVMSFRHPLRKDPRGKQGRKVRRGLSTQDETRAQALIDEMNVLLGDESWHSIAKRSEAERRFAPVIVRAFYDDIEASPSSSWEIRNEALPLPSSNDGYTQMMLVGTTGAGKTSVLRHLIGSHPERDGFPSTSASRTTISDIEIITAEERTYKAVVTFFTESQVHTNVYECVADACAALWEDADDEKLAERLLTHRDLRFRLGYIIGTWKQTGGFSKSTSDDWAYDEEDTEQVETKDDKRPTDADLERMHQTLKQFLARLRALAADAKERLQAERQQAGRSADLLSLAGQDKEEAQDRFEDIVQTLPDFDELVNDIIDEIQIRFGNLSKEALRTHPNGWPQSWRFEATDRDSFIAAVRRFSSNTASAFGTLLTPLVDGIRIRGQFFPTFTDERPRLVLLDGEGIGHVEDSAAGVSARIAKRFADVDVILLVDSAKAPMLDAPTSVLRSVAASGYQKNLAIAFTHFDLLRGQANLPSTAEQRAHVLSSVNQKLVSLRDVVGQPAVRALERDLDQRCFMLGYLDREITAQQRGAVAGLRQLIAFCKAAIAHVPLPDVSPVYDTAGLVLAIQAATTDFHARWDIILGFKRSGNIRTAHWAEIKALNRRVALDSENGEYKDLKPVADFVARLSESITLFLDRPLRWEPRVPGEAESDEGLARVQRAVFTRLHTFVEEKLLKIPRKDWVRAFDYRGPGSTFDRKKVIQTIYDSSAPIPGPALDPQSEEFLRDVRLLAHEAIREGGGKLVSDVLGQSAKEYSS
jgi:hypothetical protein